MCILFWINLNDYLQIVIVKTTRRFAGKTPNFEKSIISVISMLFSCLFLTNKTSYVTDLEICFHGKVLIHMR